MNNTTTRRNAHFMAAVYRTAAGWSGKNFSMHEIIQSVIDGPAPEFYVSYDTAYRYVNLARLGRLPNTQNGTRRRQWNDLAARVKQTMSRHAGITCARALQIVLEQGNAPSFYLTMSTAKALYYSQLAIRKKHKYNSNHIRHTIK